MDETLRGGLSNFRNLKELDPEALKEAQRAGPKQGIAKGTHYTFSRSDRHRGGVIRGAQRTMARLARTPPSPPRESPADPSE